MISNKNVVPILIALAIVVTMTLVGVKPINAQPSEVWVDDDYCDGCPNDGHTWGYDAFDTIQDGIDAFQAPGTVHVAAGTYLENINFLGKAITVKSESGAENTIIDGSGIGSVVTLESGEGIDSVLDGFTITNSWWLNKFGEHESGIICRESSATIINNIIKDNNSTGIYLYKSSSVIRSNVIYGRPNFDPGPFDAILVNESRPIIEKNTIIAYDPNGNISGIFIWDTEAGLPDNFRIQSNLIKGRILLSIGSPILDFENEISNNIIIIENGYSSAINSSILDPASLLIANNTITKGNGIYLQMGSDRVRIINNIITESEIGISAAFEELSAPYSDILNNNFWNNEQNFSGIPDQIGINGNISEDPLFVDSANEDYHLTAGSPCIDSGTNIAYGLPDTDFEGDPRIIDGDSNGSLIIDIGADEYPATKIIPKAMPWIPLLLLDE